MGSKLHRIWWRLFQRGVIHFDQVPPDSYLDCFSPTAEALGSSVKIKVSEQTGAAPKPIPPRFPNKGSPSKGSQGSHGSQGSAGSQGFPRFAPGSLKVPSRFPRLDCKGSLRFPRFPSKRSQGSQGCTVKVTSRLPPGSQGFQAKVVKVPKVPKVPKVTL